ncbi:partial Modification methylase DpnIIB, partial [Gammaproteobacteria bacterium]
IIWKRSSAHSDTKQCAQHYGRFTDTIFFYSKGEEITWNQQYTPYDQGYIDRDYRRVDENGRRYRIDNLQGPGGAEKGNPYYEVMGVKRYWRYSQQKMEELIKQGRVIQTRPGAVPQYKRYLDEMPGVPVQNLWDDISVINNRSKEALGYPTQKPLALLERMLNASSNPNDVVLDPFCGCGTTVHAAQKLGRQWIGIDITPLAITLIEKRLKDAFPDAQFDVEGIPKDLDGAQNLALRDKYHFQWWACALVGAQPYQGKKKGADTGIDGLIYFQDDKGAAKKIIVSVKGGESVTRTMLADLKNTVEREGAQIGLFVTLTPPTRPMKIEAVSAGHYHSAHFGDFDKIQILTIEGLLNGTEYPQYPNRLSGNVGFKKARVEEEHGQQGELL